MIPGDEPGRSGRPLALWPLNLLVNDDDPFPAAFDDPKTIQEGLDAAGGFIVDCDA